MELDASSHSKSIEMRLLEFTSKIIYKTFLDVVATSNGSVIQGMLYPIVVFALDENNVLENGYATDPKEDFNIDLPYEKCVGFLYVRKKDDGSYYPAKSFVLNTYRRHGIAATMYNLAEKILLKPLTPSNLQSNDAKLFWQFWQNKNK